VIAVELAPEVTSALRAMKDHGAPPLRCHKGVIRSAIEGAVRRLRSDDLDTVVRPWDLPALRSRAAQLDALGVRGPNGVRLRSTTEDPGQGETRSRCGYYWTDDRGRSIIAEETTTEICDGATPYSSYVRGVIVDGGGELLTGRDGGAEVIEG